MAHKKVREHTLRNHVLSSSWLRSPSGSSSDILSSWAVHRSALYQRESATVLLTISTLYYKDFHSEHTTRSHTQTHTLTHTHNAHTPGVVCRIEGHQRPWRPLHIVSIVRDLALCVFICVHVCTFVCMYVCMYVRDLALLSPGFGA
jgi:hypothetical protein